VRELVWQRRHGAWLASVERVDVAAFGGRTLWWWRFAHDGAGLFASGHALTEAEARHRAEVELQRREPVS
jgi:hypothetical protein